MIRNAKWFGLLFTVAALAGCNQILEILQSFGSNAGSTELRAFNSESEMSDYFKQQIGQRNSVYSNFDRGVLNEVENSPSAPMPSANGDGAPVAQPIPGSGDDFSGTTVQEAGVDEADVVKNDGTYLYIIIDSSFDGSGSKLRIVQVSPSEQMGVVSETPLAGYGRDLYLHGDKIVAITTGGGYVYGYGGGVADGIPAAEVRQAEGVAPATGEATGTETAESEPISTGDEPISTDVEPVPIDVIDFEPIPVDDFVYERPHTIVTVVDVTSRSGPVVLSQTKFDGTQSATRMIDGVLHMVLANYQNYYFDVMPMMGRPELEVATVDVNTLLPTYTRVNTDGTGSAGPVVTWRELYHPVDPDGFGVVSLVSLDVDNDAQFTAVGVVAEPGLIYSSLDALYLTSTGVDLSQNARTTTSVYKVAYEGRGARPVATGSVPGRILNQYSMSEYQGNLRVATIVDAQWACGFFECTQVATGSNNVYVLEQTNDALSVLGSVEQIAPGEMIQSARFLGDKGFVVTFLQTDPLFTLDLSDPSDPRVVGELEVPGFSTFLTPMDADHLLAVGQYVPPPGESGNRGVQVSIFDVTDFANPVRSSNVIIGGDTEAYSEATWDPKAFNYFASRGLVALPVTISPIYGWGFAEDGSGTGTDETDAAPPPDSPVEIIDPLPPVDQGYDGLIVYSATPTGGLTELGRVSTRFEEAGYYWGSSFTRGVFIGDKVFAVTNLGVREASVSNVSVVENELFFGVPYVEEPPIPIDPMPVEPTKPIDSGDGTTTPGTEGAPGGVGNPIE